MLWAELSLTLIVNFQMALKTTCPTQLAEYIMDSLKSCCKVLNLIIIIHQRSIFVIFHTVQELTRGFMEAISIELEISSRVKQKVLSDTIPVCQL